MASGKQTDNKRIKSSLYFPAQEWHDFWVLDVDADGVDHKDVRKEDKPEEQDDSKGGS